MPFQFAAHKALGAAVGSAAAVLAVLPGVAVFREGVYAPPGYEKIFGSIITVISTLALLLLTLYRQSFARASRGRIVKVTLGISGIGLSALAGFAYARARAVCPGPNNSESYVLIFRPQVVVVAAKQSEGICRAVAESGASVSIEVHESPGLLIASNAVFLALYIAMNVSVVAALSIASWRVAQGAPEEIAEASRAEIVGREVDL